MALGGGSDPRNPPGLMATRSTVMTQILVAVGPQIQTWPPVAALAADVTMTPDNSTCHLDLYAPDVAWPLVTVVQDG